ncbi:MAG: response regulator [Proteobacteria bacterium]|nr:response regulator [Pseudomonadota bacterium]MBU1649999.1 response regulator [Pseudomonadota bacterium]
MEPKTTILYAEDDPLLRRSISTYLDNCGLRVLEAENGLEAWHIFQHERPDLVLTDLRMPVMDGFEFLTKVIADSPGTPIIILSGVGTMNDVIEALRLGAWDYLTKPIAEMSILLHAINKAMERVKMLHDSRNYQQTLELKVLERTQKLEEELEERKRIEGLVIRAKQEWERTMDAMPDLIALLDINQRMIRVNKTLAAAIGLTPAEAVGQQCYLCMHSTRCPSEHCPHLQMLADGQPHTIEMYEERLGGTFEIIVVPRYDLDNTTLIGSIHIARDITARKEAEKEQKKLQSQLLHAQKLESVGQLAAGIAHEINTPTQYVGTNIDFLDDAFHDVSKIIEHFQALLKAEENDSLSPQQFKEARQALVDADWDYLSAELPSAIGQSRDGIKRVSSIVRAMKEFSHPGSKEKISANLNTIIQTTITVATNEWKYVAEVKTDFDPNLPSVQCLSDELGQVILNMIVNAAHAISEKLGANPEGQKGTITIATMQKEQWVELRISDTGAGIPDKIRQRVFDPFFTTKQVGKGTGQGLAIVHDVITEKHQGTITLESEVGVGTTFIIRLPATS